jgi:hypothetical protein
VHSGQITSFKEDPVHEWHEVWFTYDKEEEGPYGGGRGKHRFESNRFFRVTSVNEALMAGIKEKERIIKLTEEEIEAAIKKLEKPITKEDLI